MFLDVESITSGDSWKPILEEFAASCSMMLAIIGTDWATTTNDEGELRLFQNDDFVRFELSIALAREDIPVVPVLIQDAELPMLEQLPENIQSLAGRQAIELRSGIHFRNDILALVEKVKDRFDLLNTP